MALYTSPASASLKRKPLAPARIASNTLALLGIPVRIITFVSGASRRIIFVALMPSIPGRCRSINTTSGRRCQASSTAPNPSAASPTITSSGSHPRNTRSPSRTMRWSSTIKTRIVMSASPRLQVRLYRKLNDEHRMGHREQEHTSCLTFRIRSKSVCCEQT